MEPLRHETAGFEATGAELVELAAENTANTHGPWIGGLSDDNVIGVGTELQNCSRVFLSNADEPIGQHSVIFRLEKFGGAHDRLAVLCDGNIPNRIAK